MLGTQKFMKKHRYRLFAMFMGATMVRDTDDQPVQFELSMGNFGNLLDETTSFCASATQPAYTRALRDCTPDPDENETKAQATSVDYSFVPWTVSARKPCVLLDTFWEDVLYRAEASNAMAFIVDCIVHVHYIGSVH